MKTSHSDKSATSKIALITGATSGIGRATAELFAQNGLNLILCGRRKERLEQISKQLQETHAVKVHTLCFDVKNRLEITNCFESLPIEWQAIDILVNNAGNAHGLANCADANLDDWDEMIDTNVKGLLYVTKYVIPHMIKRKSGHIINIGSIAGKEVYPLGNAYCASKFAVDAFTKGLRMDLISHNIKVSAVHPGMVNTEFSVVRFKGDQQRADAVYQGMQPLTAKDIAETIQYMISCPPHVNIADIVIFPTCQASSTLVQRND